MSVLPRDADRAAGLDVAFLGVTLFAIVRIVRSVSAVPRETPELLRLAGGSTVPATAPELGLLRPGGGQASAVDIGLTVGEVTWAVLTRVTLLGGVVVTMAMAGRGEYLLAAGMLVPLTIVVYLLLADAGGFP